MEKSHYFLPNYFNHWSVREYNKNGFVALVMIAPPSSFKKLEDIVEKLKNKNKIRCYGTIIQGKDGLPLLMYTVVSAIPKISALIVFRDVCNKDCPYTGIYGPTFHPTLEEIFREPERIRRLDLNFPVYKEGILDAFLEREIIFLEETTGNLEKLIKKIDNVLENIKRKKVRIIQIKPEEIERGFGSPKHESVAPNVLFYETLEEAYLSILWRIYFAGHLAPSRHGETKELLFVSFFFERPWVGESILEKIGISNETLEKYVKDSIEGKGSYAYGKRVKEVLGKIIEKLKKDPLRRDCYIPIFRLEDIYEEHPPCLVGLQFMIREGKLYTIAIFRSWDFLNAAIPNLYLVSKLTEMVSREIKIEIGGYYIIGVSVHYYLRDEWKIKRLPRPRGDTRILKIDNLHLEVIPQGNLLVARVVNTEYAAGKRIHSWQDVYNFARGVVRKFGVLDPTHAAYIGIEIARKAKDILELGKL